MLGVSWAFKQQSKLSIVPCLLVTISPLGLFPDRSTIGAADVRAAKPARAAAHQYFIIATNGLNIFRVSRQEFTVVI